MRDQAKRGNPLLSGPNIGQPQTDLHRRSKRKIRSGCLWICLSGLLIAQAAQAQVTGDLNSDSGNTNSTVGSNNISTSESTTYSGAGSAPFSTPVPTAAAPTVMGGGGNDSCLIPKQQAFQISIFGRAEGSMEQDGECNRRKDARLLGTPQEVGGLGLQVSGISVMCNNPDIFKAMALASTPCPIYSIKSAALLVGRDAYIAMRDNPNIYVVGYKNDRVFWDAFLSIGKDLPDVAPDTNIGPLLSERFRRAGRFNDAGSESVGTGNPRQD